LKTNATFLRQRLSGIGMRPDGFRQDHKGINRTAKQPISLLGIAVALAAWPSHACSNDGGNESQGF